eukprot:gene39782-48435_t
MEASTEIKVSEDAEYRCYEELEQPLPSPPSLNALKADISMEDKINSLRLDIIGAYAKFVSPFGDKPIIYSDWTASSRCVGRIEDFMRNVVLPFYGNTHTTSSVTGHQATCFRHEARQIVAESVNAKVTGKAAEDVVLFCGAGTTSCVNKLISLLGLDTPFASELMDDDTCRPVVFVSSYEHHSNLIPWREAQATVVTVGYDVFTGVSLSDLEAQLQKYADRKVKIGSFSAASNVTGVVTDARGVSSTMHKHGGLCFLDAASLAPHNPPDINPSQAAALDAVFFSAHKLLGGVGGAGVLVVKKHVLPSRGERPSGQLGGGTVFFVTDQQHRFLSNREEREEGGTPDLLADVRTGLALHLLREVGVAYAAETENQLTQHFLARISADSRIHVLGGEHRGPRLPIFSFLIQCHARYLHFQFVSVLLNDLFGIQARGGCMCAGPWAQRLLGMSARTIRRFEQALLDKHEILRPGFSRLSLTFFTSRAEVDYIADALLFLA